MHPKSGTRIKLFFMKNPRSLYGEYGDSLLLNGMIYILNSYFFFLLLYSSIIFFTISSVNASVEG